MNSGILTAEVHMTRLNVFIMMILLIVVPSVIAQKFGKVSKEELSMVFVEEDPEADAVFLLDKTVISITDKFELETECHIRVKILTERGIEKYADISIPYWHEDKLSDFKAHTIQRTGEKIKVNKKSVFQKKHDRFHTTVFAFPSVQAGSILEYHYKIWSKYISNLEPWYFQNPEITRVAHMEVIMPPGFNYRLLSIDPLGYDLTPEQESVFMPGRTDRSLTRFTWHFENVPALKQEPYMINEMDHRSRIHFLIVSYRNNYGGLHEFYKTWEDIRKRIWEIYEPFISQKGSVKSTALAVTADSLNQRQKIQALYDFVRSEIVTADYRGVLNANLIKPREVLSRKEGSAAEKNLLLIALLKCAGFQADPVMISTRENGLFNENLPGFFQFNHVIVRVRCDSKNILLDAGDVYCPFGNLPEADLTNKGLCVQEKNEEFISIPKPDNISMKFTETDASLTEDGNINCTTRMRFEGYRAVHQRHKLAKTDEESYIREIIEDRFAEVTLDSFQIQGKEQIESPLYLVMQYSVQGYAQSSGDMIYMNPNLFHYLESNPFKKEMRLYDVEFSYLRYACELVKISLPDGFEVQEIPSARRVNGPDATFGIRCTSKEQTIEYQKDLKIRRVVYPARIYQNLRDFYSDMVEANQSQIVLMRAD